MLSQRREESRTGNDRRIGSTNPRLAFSPQSSYRERHRDAMIAERIDLGALQFLSAGIFNRPRVPRLPLPWLASSSRSMRSGQTLLPAVPWHRGFRFQFRCKGQSPRAPEFRRSAPRYPRPQSLLLAGPPVHFHGLAVLHAVFQFRATEIPTPININMSSNRARVGFISRPLMSSRDPGNKRLRTGRRPQSKDHPESPLQWRAVFVRLQSVPDCRAGTPPRQTRAEPVRRDLECEPVPLHEFLLQRTGPRRATQIFPAHLRLASCSQLR